MLIETASFLTERSGEQELPLQESGRAIIVLGNLRRMNWGGFTDDAGDQLFELAIKTGYRHSLATIDLHEDWKVQPPTIQ